MRRNRIVIRIALDSMLSALYFVLAYLTIAIGNVHITLASLAVVFAATSIGLGDSLIIALLGEVLIQLLKYGLTVTTAAWILPPAFRGLVIGIAALIYWKKKDRIENHLVVYYLILVLASLVTSAANTGVIFLDAYVYQYPVSYALVETIVRFAVGLATAIVTGTINLPLTKLYHKNFQKN
jgi:uncharacterized membrane protein